MKQFKVKDELENIIILQKKISIFFKMTLPIHNSRFKQWGINVDYEWQVSQVEFWLKKHYSL